jgi:type I restriction enzyme M protein
MKEPYGHAGHILKMAHEQTQPPFNRPAIVPEDYNWASLLDLEGDALEIHYRHVLEHLGRGKGLLGVIFRKAQNKIQDPAKLRQCQERNGTVPAVLI